MNERFIQANGKNGKLLVLDKIRVSNGGNPIDCYLVQNAYGDIDTIAPCNIKKVYPIGHKWEDPG